MGSSRRVAGAVAPARASASSRSFSGAGREPSPISSMRRAMAYTADSAVLLDSGSSRMPHEKLRACWRVIRSHSRYASVIVA